MTGPLRPQWLQPPPRWWEGRRRPCACMPTRRRPLTEASLPVSITTSRPLTVPTTARRSLAVWVARSHAHRSCGFIQRDHQHHELCVERYAGADRTSLRARRWMGLDQRAAPLTKCCGDGAAPRSEPVARARCRPPGRRCAQGSPTRLPSASDVRNLSTPSASEPASTGASSHSPESEAHPRPDWRAATPPRAHAVQFLREHESPPPRAGRQCRRLGAR